MVPDLVTGKVQHLDHGVSHRRPIRFKHDVFADPGPGMEDMHYEVELGIVMAGRMSHRNRDWDQTFGPGDIWMTGVWEPHSAEILEGPLELAVFHIYPPLLARWRFPECPDRNWVSFFVADPERRPQKMSDRSDIWLQIAREAIAVSEQRDQYQGLIWRSLLMRFLVEIARAWEPFEDASAVNAEVIDHIGRAIDAVFSTSHRLSVTEGAAIAGMNRHVFTQRFQDVLGMSFAEFSLSHRLFLASQALRRTDLPLKTIAARYGFTDKSHLHRRFTELFGMTPREFRQNQQNALDV